MAITTSIKKDDKEKTDKNNLNIIPNNKDNNNLDSKNSIASVLDINNLRFENFMAMDIIDLNPEISNGNNINKNNTIGGKNNNTDSGLLSPLKKTSNENNPELFSAQKSYIDDQNSQKLLSILSIKNESLVLPPTHPVYEKKETKKLMAFEDHELNEKSKKKINPEIFIQLKVGIIANAYKVGQLLGEGTNFFKDAFFSRKCFIFLFFYI